MAKIIEETVVFKVSQLTKDSDQTNPPEKLTGEVISTLEQVATEILGDDCVVEVIKE